MDLKPLKDETLLARLEALAAQERENLADIVEHLMEADRRGTALDLGFPSLFKYCTDKLHYAESAAYSRIRAARAAVQFPEVLPRLRSGQLHLDAVVRLYPHLTEANQSGLLERAEGATSRQILGLVAELGGAKPEERDVMRPLAPAPAAPMPMVPDAVVPPPKRLRFEFTADEELVAMVDRLRSLLRHKYPFARLEEIFKEAAALLIARIDPDLKSPGKRKAKGGRSRRIPEWVRRLVWKRDAGRCAFVSEDGRRCESNAALEFDHVTPWALGGASDDPRNIRLLCRPHNQRQARKRFGPRR